MLNTRYEHSPVEVESLDRVKVHLLEHHVISHFGIPMSISPPQTSPHCFVHSTVLHRHYRYEFDAEALLRCSANAESAALCAEQVMQKYFTDAMSVHLTP